MKVLLISLCLATFAAAAPTPAERLLETMRYEETAMQAGIVAMDPMFAQLEAQGTGPAAIEEIRAAAREFLLSIVADEKITAQVAALYEEQFTEQEILALIEFYETPLGSKLIEAQSPIAVESMRITQKAGQQGAPEFGAKVSAILEKHAEPQEDAPEPEN